MREKKPFGKRYVLNRELPSDEKLKNTFAVVNNGCDSKQVVEFIKKATGHKIRNENDATRIDA